MAKRKKKGQELPSISKQSAREIVASREVSYSVFEGDYPPPAVLSAYPEEIRKSLVSLTEKEQDHRHAYFEKEQAHRQQFNNSNLFLVASLRKWGIISGTLIAIITILAGAYLVSIDKNLSGLAVLVGAAAALIGTAIYGHKTSFKSKSNRGEGDESGKS